MTVPEIIARLDVFERALVDTVMEIRQIRLDLFDTLDFDSEDVVE